MCKSRTQLSLYFYFSSTISALQNLLSLRSVYTGERAENLIKSFSRWKATEPSRWGAL